jgi:radical SAM protein with 4Fe4S-binding SPASM domain
MKLINTAKMPTWITFQLLERCNLRCNMCYEWGVNGSYLNKKKLAVLPLDKVLSIVDECLTGSPKFEFFGGEPMMYQGIWQVIDRIIQGGAEVSFSTNGTYLEKYAEQLVASQPTKVWVSLDGPQTINDLQRGRGVFAKATQGIKKVVQLREAQGVRFPQLGVTYVVTPDNYQYIEQFFLQSIDLSILSSVSIELQSYATAQQVADYESVLKTEFDVDTSSCARGYIQDEKIFSDMNINNLVRQLKVVSRVCKEQGIQFYSQPGTLEEENIQHYLSAQWEKMTDKKSRCAVPWMSVEISAQGDVSTCHSFYDLPIGNIYQQSLADIWNGERLKKVQQHLRHQLFPICTACCRYYGGAGTLKSES